MICDWLEVRVLHRRLRCVLMPERSKGYDSSSYGENLVGSNPTQHNTSDSGGWECGWYRSRSRVRVRVVPQAGSKWFDSTRCLFITHARVSVIGQRTRLLPGEMQVRILPWAMGRGEVVTHLPAPSTHNTWIITEKISVATCARMTRIDREDAPFFSSPSAAAVCMR